MPIATVTPGQAVLSEIVNLVQVSPSEREDWSAANEGQQIAVGDQVQTFADSSVKIYFWEGTITRLDANTLFVLEETNTGPGDPFTRVRLLVGKLWAVLARGSLDVVTPVGVASVRGSLLSVAYEPGTQVVTVTCLEGDCTLRVQVGTDDQGQPIFEEVVVPEGSQAIIAGVNTPPEVTGEISEDELNDWLKNVPEAEIFVLPPGPGTVPLGGGGSASADWPNVGATSSNVALASVGFSVLTGFVSRVWWNKRNRE